jgi:hypothetical protein
MHDAFVETSKHVADLIVHGQKNEVSLELIKHKILNYISL